MALDHLLREVDTPRSRSALRALKHVCTRPADSEKSLAVSIRSTVLVTFLKAKFRATKATGDSEDRNTKTSVSREQKRQQQSTGDRPDAGPPTPPPSEDVSAESSPRDAVVGSRRRVTTAAGDSEDRKTETSVSREQKGQQQSTEVRLDATCSPPTPPPSEDVTAESGPRDAVVGSRRSLGEQDQEQRPEEEEAIPPTARSVSFNEVVKEVLIEDRYKTYGDTRASRRQHFYSREELAVFKRAWYWHVKSSSIHWPVDRLLRCGCPGCDKDEGRVPVQEVQKHVEDEYSRWTWEG